MPKRCVAANCSNVASEHISLFKFPKDVKLSQEWTKQVQRTREWKGPTVSSLVCSAHFLPECFDNTVSIKESLGFKQQHKRVLLPSAIPTVFRRKCEDPSQSSPKRRSTAVLKLERKRITTEALTEASAVQIIVPDPDFIHDGIDFGAEKISNSSDVACQTNHLPTRTRSVGVSVKCKGKSKGTQTESSTNITVPVKQFVSVQSQTGSESSESSDIESEKESSPSSEYLPSSSDTDSSFSENEPNLTETMDEEMNNSIHKGMKYIVFLTALVRLLTWVACPGCGHKDLKWSKHEIGTMLIITLFCEACGKTTPWHSQPYLGNIPAGNILLSAAILFSGATATKVLRVLQHMGVAAISTRTFFRHQCDVLQKAIRHAWEENQAWLLASLQGVENRLICGGDGRADSPGHSAKYGTYTLIELQERVVLDIELVQSNQCGGSYHMEKMGLVSSLEVLKENHLEIDVLVTDRHRQIAKYIREEHPLIHHLYDVWHVAKGLKTKLRAAGRKAGCQSINAWISSIVNHLYWSASSTPEGQGDLIEAKWKSVLDHVQNHHQGFGGEFPKCDHGQLEGREARKKWIKPCSKAAMELEKIITNKSLCRDVRSLSGEHQTSVLEAFHSLLIQFAPKMFAFSYEGMLCRTMLAALHHNENSGRRQRKTGGGKFQYSLHYPKFKQGGYVVKKLLVPETYDYVDDLMKRIAGALTGEHGDDIIAPLTIPPPLNADFVRPDKEEAVLAHISRFKSH